MRPPRVHILVTLALVAFKTGECIKCYSCLSSEQPDCIEPERYGVKKVRCDLSALDETRNMAAAMHHDFAKIFEVHLQNDVIPLNCLKQVTKVQGGQEIILRGCHMPKDNRLDVCKKLAEIEKSDAITIEHCSLCGQDECNVGHRIRTTIYILFTLVGLLHYL